MTDTHTTSLKPGDACPSCSRGRLLSWKGGLRCRACGSAGGPPAPKEPLPLTVQLARASWITPLLSIGMLGMGVPRAKEEPIAIVALAVFAGLLALAGLAFAAASLAGIRRHPWPILRNAIPGVVLGLFALLPLVLGGVNFVRIEQRKATAANDTALESAVALVNDGRWSEGEAALRAYLEEPGHPVASRVLAQSQLGLALHRQEKTWDGYLLLREAEEAASRRDDVGPGVRAVAQDSLGLVMLETGETELAAPLLEAALAGKESAYGRRSVGYAMTLNNVAVLRVAQGRYEEAEAALREAIEITAPRNPQLAATYAMNLEALTNAEAPPEL